MTKQNHNQLTLIKVAGVALLFGAVAIKIGTKHATTNPVLTPLQPFQQVLVHEHGSVNAKGQRISSIEAKLENIEMPQVDLVEMTQVDLGGIPPKNPPTAIGFEENDGFSSENKSTPLTSRSSRSDSNNSVKSVAFDAQESTLSTSARASKAPRLEKSVVDIQNNDKKQPNTVKSPAYSEDLDTVASKPRASSVPEASYKRSMPADSTKPRMYSLPGLSSTSVDTELQSDAVRFVANEFATGVAPRSRASSVVSDAAPRSRASSIVSDAAPRSRSSSVVTDGVKPGSTGEK